MVKVETTYGVDILPIDTDAINCFDIEYEALSQEITRKNIVLGFDPVASIFIGEGQKLSFSVELAGSGTAGTAPQIGKLFRACNFNQTISAGVSVTYTPHSSSSLQESVTLYYYVDGLMHKMTGCRGSFSLVDAKVNQPAILKFEFTGLYGGVPAAGSVSTWPYNTYVPPLFKSAQFTLDSYAAIVNSVSIDFKNEIAKRTSINASNGILEWFIKSRAITAKIDPEMVVPTTKDFWGMWLSAAPFNFSVRFGSTAGNICTINANYTQLETPKYGERESMLTADLSLGFKGYNSNPPATIVFT